MRCFCYNTATPGESPPGRRGGTLLRGVETPEDTPPATADGMEGALHYYNSLPPSIFRGARGAGAAPGLAHAIQYATAIARQDTADGASFTLAVLLTPGQGIDGASTRAALGMALALPVSLSVLAIGVGDGPFHDLGRLAAAFPENMNAIDFHAAVDAKFPDRKLAVEAFRVLPEQAELAAKRRVRDAGQASGQ